MSAQPYARLPTHLSGSAAAGILEGHPIAQFEIGAFRNFVYLVLDWSRRKAAIIDPHSGKGPGLAPVFAELRARAFSLEHVLLTHSHWDHIDGIDETLRSWGPKLEILIHREDAHRLDAKLPPGTSVRHISDGDRVNAGSIEIQVLHTPGHSAGECCFRVETSSGPFLFTGDTVFIRDCGRTDLESGSSREMFVSLQRLKTLPPETVFLPGHHYAPECATTLERELRESPPFLCATVEELEALP